MPEANSHPALFLDRDGVIIENRPSYVRSWADVDIYPQALQALATFSDQPYQIIIVSNQSAIGRGLLSLAEAEAINKRLVEVIEAAGGRVDAVFMCPHTPEEKCNCRKPKAGLLLQAAEVMSLDLGRSLMIGDALSDLQAGQAAGVGRSILVRTGRGKEQETLAEAEALRPFPVFDTLADALDSLSHLQNGQLAIDN
jgi:D-glycero-D-manno-heptose 1,7-bisphosphate phosphatase